MMMPNLSGGNVPLISVEKGFLYRIRARLLLIFSAVAVLGMLAMEVFNLLGLPPLGVEGLIQQTRQHSLQSLNEIANVRRNTLQQWLIERRRDTQVMSGGEMMSAATVALSNQISSQGKRGPIDADYWAQYQRSAHYVSLRRELQSLRDASDGTYERVSLLDADSGYVIASSSDRGDQAVGISLIEHPLFERARSPGNQEVVDLFVSPLDGLTYLAFTQQIFEYDGAGNKGELRAIAVFLTKSENIPLASGDTDGLGRTGETVLLNHDRRIMSPLRHALVNGTQAKRMEYRLETRIAELAASGGEGLLAEWDYRGVPVLGAYRHVLVSQDLGWGIIVKQDESEVLAPIYARLKQRIVLALAAFLFLIFGVGALSRRFSAPIETLAATARALKNGDLAARSGLDRRDEIGMLARTFDSMAQRMQDWQESLSRELAARTSQLVRANQLYHTLSETNQAIVHTHGMEMLFAQVCRIAVESGQFKAAWITRLDEGNGRFRRECYFPDGGPKCWDTISQECGSCSLAGVCEAGSEPSIVNDVANDTRCEPCREILLQIGWRSMASFPLQSEGSPSGTFTVVSDKANVFDAQETALLTEMAGDIGFAIQNIMQEKRRNAAEEAVRVQEVRLEAITSSVLDAVISIDQNGTIEFWNPAAEKLFGYSAREAIGCPVHDLLTPTESREAAHSGFGHFNQNGTGPLVGKTVEVMALRRDGKAVQVELSISAVKDGNAWRAVAIVRDITERKKAEGALRLVAEELSIASGANFFQAAATGLAKLLGADYALVGELYGEEEAIVTVGLATPDGVADNIRYALAGMPCASTMEVGVRIYPSAVATLFPEGKMLIQMGVEAYAGMRLMDSAGNAIGIIAVLWRRPLEENEHPEPILRIFAARAAAELMRFHSEQSLRASERERMTLSYAVEQGPTGVVITDPGGNIEYVNSKFVETTGYTLEESVGKNPRFLKSDVMPPETYQQLWQTITSGEAWRGEMCNRKRNGELYWVAVTIAPLRDEQGRVNHYVELAEDITLRKQYEAQLVHQAHYDELTGLPNRILALDRMLGAIARAERGTGKVAILIIDLDNFKQINDTLGHDVGDSLLKLAAERLCSCVREVDSVSRLGGDEFLVVVSDVHDAADVESIAIKISTFFSEDFLVEGHEIYSTVSIGITVSPEDGVTPGELLRNADAAMYLAKAGGRDTYRFFSAEGARLSERRLRVENRLRRAVERREFHLVYQPIMDLRSGRPVGAEALLRWNNEELNPIFPDEFIAVAEDSGLIVSIGEYVLKAACSEAADWQDILGMPLRIAVNVSARQLRAHDFIAMVGQVLAKTSLSPALLEIEITERAVVDDVSEAAVVLESLRAMGIRISMDDFGTGYSSLSYLHDLPIDTLKIDKSFVRDIVSDTNDARLTEAIIAIGRSLDLDVLAEGVEEKDQLEFLQQHGCDLAQGYYFSKPIASMAFRELLSQYQVSADVPEPG